MCKQIHSSSGRMISSRLKYSRKATPTFGRENLFFNFTNYLLELGAATRCRRHAVRSVLLRLKYLRRVSESVF